MKRFQFIALVLLSFCFIVEVQSSQEIGKCNVIPKISMSEEGSEISFRVTKNSEELNTFDNIEHAINIACNMQKNNECFYSSACK